MTQLRRPDFIDRFYADVGKIATVTDQLNRLAKKGIELAEAGKTTEAEAIQKRCEALNARRMKYKARWESYLRAKGIL